MERVGIEGNRFPGRLAVLTLIGLAIPRFDETVLLGRLILRGYVGDVVLSA